MTFQYIYRILAALVCIFSLTLSALTLQTLAAPKDNQTIPLSKFVPQSPVDQFDMMVQLTPTSLSQSMREEGWYDVLGWQLALSNPSSLCPTQNCSFQLDGGRMAAEFTPGERTLSGKLRVGSGDTTKIQDLYADWAAIEERVQGGQIVQVIQGTLGVGVGPDTYNRANQYQINGTLAPYGQDLILTIHGAK